MIEATAVQLPATVVVTQEQHHSSRASGKTEEHPSRPTTTKAERQRDFVRLCKAGKFLSFVTCAGGQIVQEPMSLAPPPSFGPWGPWALGGP